MAVRDYDARAEAAYQRDLEQLIGISLTPRVDSRWRWIWDFRAERPAREYWELKPLRQGTLAA